MKTQDLKKNFFLTTQCSITNNASKSFEQIADIACIAVVNFMKISHKMTYNQQSSLKIVVLYYFNEDLFCSEIYLCTYRKYFKK